MIFLPLFFVLCASGCKSVSQADSSKEPNVVERRKAPFREELSRSGGPLTNFYFTRYLIINFPDAYALNILTDIVKECRKKPLSSEGIKWNCRRFKHTEMKEKCQIAMETFYTPNGYCFLQEERDRENLKQRGVDIINEKSRVVDVLHILNRIRGGRMSDIEEIMYYIHRCQIYAKISQKGWKPLLQKAEILILYEWRRSHRRCSSFLL